jgi:hypothetical protein
MAAETPPYRVSRENRVIVIRVPEDLISDGELTRFGDWLVVKQGRRKFSLSDKEIAAIADEVDAAAWERLRPLVEARLRVHADVRPRITEEANEFVVRIPKDVLTREEVERYLDLAILQRGSRRLGFTEQEFAEFAAEAKRSSAERLRPVIEEKLRGG